MKLEYIRCVSAFPGIGKSYFVEQNPMVLDSDSSKFDKSKFPDNYVSHIAKSVYDGKCILVSSHADVRAKLVEYQLLDLLVYPSISSKNAYIDRYRKRGSSPQFVEMLDKQFENFVRMCQAQTGCRHVELDGNTYLSDVIRFNQATKHLEQI